MLNMTCPKPLLIALCIGQDGVHRIHTSEVLALLGPAVSSIFPPVQEAAERIKKHGKFKMPVSAFSSIHFGC